MKQKGQVSTHIQGIPCLIAIGYYHKQKPLGMQADSDHDARGYTDAEYTVLDRKGYPAKWLERKMNDLDRERVVIAIEDYKDAEAEEARYERAVERREYEREGY